MRGRIAVLIGFVSLFWLGIAAAQPAADTLLRAATLTKDLEFPSSVSTLSVFSTPKMALYRPEGAGPFPALVLMHQCGGLRSANGRWQNTAMLGWAKEAVARGYVALLVDSLDARNVDTLCMGAKNGVNFARGLRDALQAGEHLRTLAFVDKDRIALAGFSWGAMVGVLAGSKLWASAVNSGPRFAAVASFYPGCFTIRPPQSTPYEIVNGDIDRPLLVQMGGKDSETPAAECLPRLERLKSAGAPVEWQLYPEATHCWDCENLDGFRKVDVRGSAVEYRYNREVTKQSADRMFAFFERVFDAQR